MRFRNFYREACTGGGKLEITLCVETLQTTGFYVGRDFIVTRESASFSTLLPDARSPGTARQVIGVRFLRHGGIYRSDVIVQGPPPLTAAGSASGEKSHNATRSEPSNPGHNAAFHSACSPGKERAGRTASCSSSAMSSGRLFLDRVARQHCPSPLHRHHENKTLARLNERNYH